jgi:hypothetical protein
MPARSDFFRKTAGFAERHMKEAMRKGNPKIGQ